MSHDESRQGSWPTAALSRRRLLRASALATAAVPLGLLGPPPARAGVDDDTAYRAAFGELLKDRTDVRLFDKAGAEFLYRPGQLLVATPDVDRVVRRLADMGLKAEVTDRFAGVVKLLLDPDADIPTLVGVLRDPAAWPKQDPPVVQPHHVVVGHSDNIMGNPDGAPVAVAAPAWPPAGSADEGRGVLVGLCDTGIWRDAATVHPGWLGGSYVPEPDDEDPLYLSADLLGLEAGHGTFVAGVLRRAAPGVQFDPEVALDDSGIGDEQSLVEAIGRLDPYVAVISLSLGFFSHDDREPVPVRNALSALKQGTVVVASAGNSAGTRRCWPAALPEVVAVAAVTRSVKSGALSPAAYSNFGSWVDVCAEGERTSTYVSGRMPLGGSVPLQFDGYAQWRGTSFAAPHVAGRLAALMTTYGYTAAAAKAYLLSLPAWHPDFGVFVP